MELARGTIAERPWALTLATFARRGTTGQLTLQGDHQRIAIALENGHIVAARSPHPADSVARIALTMRLVRPSIVNELNRHATAVPSRDEVDVVGDLAKLTPSQILALRTQVILRRAARSVAPESGEFVLEDSIGLPVRSCAVDVRAIVYQGIRMHISDVRLANDLRQLGTSRFILEPHASDEVHKFGFCDGEWPLLTALRDGASLPELEARHRELDPRTTAAAIYALVACGTARAMSVGRSPSSSTAPPLSLPRTKTNPELAAEAAERASRALATERLDVAVVELKKAVQLVPNDVDYNALLGWALFCAADDKHAAAGETRKLLERAMYKSQKPQRARFYLGRVERILGRDREALQHFQAVLSDEPNNRDASAEVRVIQARLRRLGPN